MTRLSLNGGWGLSNSERGAGGNAWLFGALVPPDSVAGLCHGLCHAPGKDHTASRAGPGYTVVGFGLTTEQTRMIMNDGRRNGCVEHRAHRVLLFAALLIVGGVLGYAQKNSLPSLLGGGVGGILALAAALLVGSRPTVGAILGLATALLIGVRFAVTFAKEPKVWPAGATLAASLVALVVAVLVLVQARSAASTGAIRAATNSGTGPQQ
jgi:uncharacterized membrane protein (UPF0136 family)